MTYFSVGCYDLQFLKAFWYFHNQMPGKNNWFSTSSSYLLTVRLHYSALYMNMLHVHMCLWMLNIETNLFNTNIKCIANKFTPCAQFIDLCLQCADIWPVLLRFQDLHYDLSSIPFPGSNIRLLSVHAHICAAVHLPASELHVREDSLNSPQHRRLCFLFPWFHIKIPEIKYAASPS